MIKLIKAKTARQTANDARNYGPIFRSIVKEIKKKSNQGEYEAMVFTGGIKLSDKEIKYISRSGYKIRWDFAILSYIINW